MSAANDTMALLAHALNEVALFTAMTLPALLLFCSFALLLLFCVRQHYTLAVKIDADISWCRLLHYLIAFRRLDAGSVPILTVAGFFHCLQAALDI